MANVNKVILIGRLTRDVELRYTPKGSAVSELGLAMTRYRTDDANQRIEETTFVDVTLWGKQAELANEYLAKGREVYIEGRLHLDTWQDKQTGQNRNKLRVVGEVLQFIGSAGQKGSGEQANSSRQKASEPSHSNSHPVGGSPANIQFEEEDDIPF
jgi:single-strand DNA-binding protein